MFNVLDVPLNSDLIGSLKVVLLMNYKDDVIL